MIVSGVCGEFYYAAGWHIFYIPQSAVAQVPEATSGADTGTHTRACTRGVVEATPNP